MSACTCSEQVQWLKQQVSVMRKELKNLRQHAESSARAHMKHMVSLKEVLDKKTLMKKSPSSSLSSESAAVPELSLEKGSHDTLTSLLTEGVAMDPVEEECVENSGVSPSGGLSCAEIPAGVDINTVLEELREFHLQGAEDKHTPAAAPEKEEEEEEWNSSVASWIRKPPVHTLSVRFTPTAERQLSDFLPAHCSGHTQLTLTHTHTHTHQRQFNIITTTRI
ncbi:hypothetical protein Baya_16309 [Bagarius yarrelli]|uniref:Uncharacterized protein n=1 Tax=Bagarius yarrelli TaxID=175774 RepID=A0A556VV82_BAGYA|nr:hypothetical protein Baya_16309 [Bagarius yarrelli]